LDTKLSVAIVASNCRFHLFFFHCWSSTWPPSLVCRCAMCCTTTISCRTPSTQVLDLASLLLQNHIFSWRIWSIFRIQDQRQGQWKFENGRWWIPLMFQKCFFLDIRLGMAKWVRSAGLACQPAQKRAGRVGISNPSTRCNSARLAHQFSGPKRAGPPTRFFYV